jgi:tRNA(Arg) A34 adenosine deaminase TadA
MTKHPQARFMQAAIDLSAEAMGDDAGGPFGAVVLRGSKVIGRARNRVLADRDPSLELGLALESRSSRM